MAEPLTWIEVADTAVKIGLSGVIAAFAGFMLSRRSHQHELEREYMRKRRDTIQKVSGDFAVIHEKLSRICLRYMSFVAGYIPGSKPLQETCDEFGKFVDDVGRALYQLHVLEAELLLMGAADATRSLRQYRGGAADVNDAIDVYKPFLTPAQVREIFDRLFLQREELYHHLSEAFRAIPNDRGSWWGALRRKFETG